jgi:hypothetical protein
MNGLCLHAVGERCAPEMLDRCFWAASNGVGDAGCNLRKVVGSSCSHQVPQVGCGLGEILEPQSVRSLPFSNIALDSR